MNTSDSGYSGSCIVTPLQPLELPDPQALDLQYIP